MSGFNTKFRIHLKDGTSTVHTIFEVALLRRGVVKNIVRFEQVHEGKPACSQSREGDELACTCGLRWGNDEEDPHHGH